MMNSLDDSIFGSSKSFTGYILTSTPNSVNHGYRAVVCYYGNATPPHTTPATRRRTPQHRYPALSLSYLVVDLCSSPLRWLQTCPATRPMAGSMGIFVLLLLLPLVQGSSLLQLRGGMGPKPADSNADYYRQFEVSISLRAT